MARNLLRHIGNLSEELTRLIIYLLCKKSSLAFVYFNCRSLWENASEFISPQEIREKNEDGRPNAYSAINLHGCTAQTKLLCSTRFLCFHGYERGTQDVFLAQGKFLGFFLPSMIQSLLSRAPPISALGNIEMREKTDDQTPYTLFRWIRLSGRGKRNTNVSRPTQEESPSGLYVDVFKSFGRQASQISILEAHLARREDRKQDSCDDQYKIYLAVNKHCKFVSRTGKDPSRLYVEMVESFRRKVSQRSILKP